MMKILLFVLFISSFAHGSSYFWNCGDTAGSRYFWDRGVEAGSNYYWLRGDGPGSKYYWNNGTGYGSRYYYISGDGDWTNYSYQEGTGPGSYYFWNQGGTQGSRYYYNHGTLPSADGVITALCMQNLITHPMCLLIRQTQNKQNNYCLSQRLNQFHQLQQFMNISPNAQLCGEPSGF